MLVDADDGLALDTVHVYVPTSVTVRVWVYCAVTPSFNTVSVPWVTVVESLVQVTVVAGPPVEIQVKVSWSGSKIISPDIEMSPPSITGRNSCNGSKKVLSYLILHCYKDYLPSLVYSPT